MNLLQAYRHAAAASQRSVPSLVQEAIRLRIGPKRLGLSEYIDFQLYERDMPWKAKLAYGGQRAQVAAEELLIDDYSRFLSLDKVTMYALLVASEIRIPRVYAVYRSRRPATYTQLSSKDDLCQYLRSPGRLPVYFKRALGSYGRGNVLVAAAEGDRVTLGDGGRGTIEQLVDSLDEAGCLGWILQEPLTSHGSISALTGSSKVSGVRIHTFMGNDEVVVLKAVFKINASLKDSDNFDHGRSGNLLAAVDVRTGRILRAIAGTGLNQREVHAVPGTGAGLIDFQLPCWTDVLNLVSNAHRAFPGFLCPGWDIALCDDGPKVLEVNAFGDIDLPQHAYREPFFDERFMACLEERGLEALLHTSVGANARSPRNGRLGVKMHHWQW